MLAALLSMTLLHIFLVCEIIQWQKVQPINMQMKYKGNIHMESLDYTFIEKVVARFYQSSTIYGVVENRIYK
jgi:hypothetical protein